MTCQTFWSGGHLCLHAAPHVGAHACASVNCAPPVLAAACWGADAGADRHGRPPAQDQAGPWRQLYNNGPRGRTGPIERDEER